MKASPLISIIVNCFNSQETIFRTLQSLINQTVPSFEVIVWDNCSKDATLSIVSSIEDKRIKLFKSDKTVSRGIAGNYAINQAKGKYLAFCDSDDWWHPEKLKIQLEVLEGSYYSFVCSDFQIVNLITDSISTKYQGRKSSVLTHCNLLENYNVGLLTLLTYTQIVKKIIKDNPHDYIYMWDFNLVLMLSKEADGYFISAITAYNTIAKSSMSVEGKKEAKKEHGLWFLDNYNEIVKSCPNSKKYIDFKILQCNGIIDSKIKLQYFSLLNVLVIKIYLKVKELLLKTLTKEKL